MRAYNNSNLHTPIMFPVEFDTSVLLDMQYYPIYLVVIFLEYMPGILKVGHTVHFFPNFSNFISMYRAIFYV